MVEIGTAQFIAMATVLVITYLWGRINGERYMVRQDAESNILSGGVPISQKYSELIMAVARKFPNETRHETALRYIRDAERERDCYAAKQTENQNEKD